MSEKNENIDISPVGSETPGAENMAEAIVEGVEKSEIDKSIDELVGLGMEREQAMKIVFEVERQIKELKELDELRDEQQRKVIKDLADDTMRAKQAADSASYSTEKLESIVKKHWFRTKMMAITTWVLMVIAGATYLAKPGSEKRGDARPPGAPTKIEAPRENPANIQKDLVRAEAVAPAKVKKAKQEKASAPVSIVEQKASIESYERLFVRASDLLKRFDDINLFGYKFFGSNEVLSGSDRSHISNEGFIESELSKEYRTYIDIIIAERESLLNSIEKFIANSNGNMDQRLNIAKLRVILVQSRKIDRDKLIEYILNNEVPRSALRISMYQAVKNTQYLLKDFLGLSK